MQDTENNNSQSPENEGLTENIKSTPPKKGKGRPPKHDIEDSRLFVRGVNTETKTAIRKAAKKLDRTQGEFFNLEIREYCQGIIKDKAQPPAAPQDVKNMVAAELITFRSELVTDIVRELAAQQGPTTTEPEKKTFLQKLADLLK